MWRRQRGKDSDFVESVLLFFVLEGIDFDLARSQNYFFESVDPAVADALNLVYGAEGAFPQFLQGDEAVDGCF